MKRFNKIITENFPVLWISQALKSFLIVLTISVAGYIIGFFLPISINYVVILVFELTFFLLIVIYRIVVQSTFFDQRISFKQVYALYIVNLFFTAALGILAFTVSFSIERNAKSVLAKNNLDHDITILRIANLNDYDIRWLKLLLIFPEVRPAILKEFRTNSITSDNEFITKDIKINDSTNNRTLLPYGVNSADTSKFFTENQIQNMFDSVTISTPVQYQPNANDSAYSNPEGLKIISGLNSNTIDSLRKIQYDILERYDMPSFSGFTMIETSIDNITTNKSFSASLFKQDDVYFFLFLLIVFLYVPVISMMVILGKRYKIKFKNLSLPSCCISLILHFAFLITIFLLFFNLFGSTTPLVSAFIIATFLILPVIVFVAVKFGSPFFQSFSYQLLHYNLVWAVLLAFFYLLGDDKKDMPVPVFTWVYIISVILFAGISYYFLYQYYKLQYRPSKN